MSLPCMLLLCLWCLKVSVTPPQCNSLLLMGPIKNDIIHLWQLFCVKWYIAYRKGLYFPFSCYTVKHKDQVDELSRKDQPAEEANRASNQQTASCDSHSRLNRRCDPTLEALLWAPVGYYPTQHCNWNEAHQSHRKVNVWMRIKNSQRVRVTTERYQKPAEGAQQTVLNKFPRTSLEKSPELASTVGITKSNQGMYTSRSKASRWRVYRGRHGRKTPERTWSSVNDEALEKHFDSMEKEQCGARGWWMDWDGFVGRLDVTWMEPGLS